MFVSSIPIGFSSISVAMLVLLVPAQYLSSVPHVSLVIVKFFMDSAIYITKKCSLPLIVNEPYNNYNNAAT